MKKVIFLIVLLIACTRVPTVIFDGKNAFTVELAKTDAEKERGLMDRSSLPEDHGMLFVFDDLEPRAFWMKNTTIALDMVYIDDKNKVVEVKSDVPPCTADPCPIYTSAPAEFVLEINAGAAEENSIERGSSVVLRQ